MTALIYVTAFAALMFALSVVKCNSVGRETTGYIFCHSAQVAFVAGIVAAVIALPFMVL